MASGQEHIQQKITAFIKGYFRNELQKGFLLMLFVTISLLLLASFLEYFLFLNKVLRAILFYSWIALISIICFKNIIIPWLRLKGFIGSMTFLEASKMIGMHFKEVRDKLINVVQLSKNDLEKNSISKDLIDAAILKQSQILSPIDFTQAVSKKEKKKYGKALMLALMTILIIALVFPGVFKQGTSRLIHYNTYYTPEAPFEFILKNKNFTVLKSRDFILELQVSGNTLPNEVFIEEEGIKYKLEKISNTYFKYEFKNINEDVSFKLFADGFYSQQYLIKILAVPRVLAFKIRLEYPPYLKKQSEENKNIGDMSIPKGTKVSWVVNTLDSKALFFSFENEKEIAEKFAEGSFSFSKKMLQSTNYKMEASNEFIDSTTVVGYSISVIPDLFPNIKVEEEADTVLPQKKYFKGELKDDYGFTKLSFKYRVKSSSDTGKQRAVFLPVRLDLTEQKFYYQFDFSTITKGDDESEIEYYFEVMDNDGLVGGKSSRSQLMNYKKPSERELTERLVGENASLKQQISSAIKDAAKIQKGIEDLNKALQEKRNPTWEDKQKAEKLVEEQREFQNKVENLEQKLKNNNAQNNEHLQMGDESKAMQDELLSMMKELKGAEEQKKLLEQLKELMEKLDKQGIKDKLENLAQQNNNAKKDLERTLEFYKQLELKRMLEDNIKKLEEAAKKEQVLSEKTQDKANAKEDIIKQQQLLKDKFSEIEQNMKDLEQKDKTLENPNNIKTPEQEAKEVNEQMNAAQDQVNKNERKSASGKQKNAADKMQKMAEKMKQQQEQMASEENAENMDDLRGILENLITLSFSQEELMNKLKITNINNPQYVDYGKQQQSLKNQAKGVEDSLFALSKRAKEIKSIVSREIFGINRNMGKTIESIEARDVPNANMRQQFVMTGINNLALLLNEALQQMEQQQKDSKAKPGSASCKKPGGKSEQPSEGKLQQLRKMQEGLGKQMGMMPKKQGQGEQKPGSEEIAKMALQQMMIRNELNKLFQQQMKNGENSANFDQLLKKMDESAKDLANKRINQELMKRQQEITSRLLDAEKAEKQREQGEERISKEKEITGKRNLIDLEKYKRAESKDFEVIKSAPLFLSDFYKSKSLIYLQKIAK